MAAVVGLVEVARGITSAMFELGPEGEYKQRVWNWVALAGAFAVVAAVGGWFARRRPLLSVAAVAVGPVVVVAALGAELYAYPALRVYGPQLAAVRAFVAP